MSIVVPDRCQDTARFRFLVDFGPCGLFIPGSVLLPILPTSCSQAVSSRSIAAITPPLRCSSYTSAVNLSDRRPESQGGRLCLIAGPTVREGVWHIADTKPSLTLGPAKALPDGRACDRTSSSGACLRGFAPSRDCWYQFRGHLGTLLLQLVGQVVRQAITESFTAATAAALDGTLLAANASRHRLLNQQTLTQRWEQLRRAVAADEFSQAVLAGSEPATQQPPATSQDADAANPPR